MSVRQYIGARYVPRFSEVNNGIWSNVYTYEPLTIVKNGNDYYTSKQSVPVGIAITNTDYWAPTGNYNGAIIEINERLDALEADMGYVKPISKDSNVVFIGDSWGVGGLADAVKNKLGITNFYKSCYGGSGFVATGDAPAIDKNFEKLLTDLCNTLTETQLKSITHLIVQGDINDATSSYINLIPAAVEQFIDTAVGLLPNAKIYIFAANNSINGTWTQYAYVNQLNSKQGYKGAIVADITRKMLFTEYTNAGHLSNYNTVANAMIAALKGVPFNPGTASKTVHVSYANLSISNKDLSFFQNNDKLYVYFGTWYFNGTFTYTGTASITGTLDDNLVPYVNGYAMTITCNVKYQGDSDYTAVPAIVQFVNNTVVITLYGKYANTITELLFPALYEVPVLW